MQIGAQLYIYKTQFDLEKENDLRTVLASLKSYTGVEGLLGNSYSYRHLLDECGLSYWAVHLVSSDLQDLILCPEVSGRYGRDGHLRFRPTRVV